MMGTKASSRSATALDGLLLSRSEKKNTVLGAPTHPKTVNNYVKKLQQHSSV